MAEYERILEQEEIMSSKNKNLIVSASAGSGKTTVMIRKIISLITEAGVNVRELLVLTYTKASAEEMKQKLLSKLTELSRSNTALLKQIDDLPTANISTIDSFFQKIIKKYFYILNLEPNFNVIDEKESENLKTNSLSLALEKFWELCPEGYEKLIDFYSGDRTENKLGGIIKDFSEFLTSIENKEEWLEKVSIKLYGEASKNLALEILNEQLCHKVAGWSKNLDEFLRRSVSLKEDYYSSYINNMLSLLSPINLKKDFFENRKIIKEINFPRLNYVEGSKIHPLFNEFKTAISREINKEKARDITFDTLNAEFEQGKKVVLWLIQLYKIYANEYASLKKEKNALDFGDLEYYADKLLDNLEIRKKIARGIKYIFIDEYQDANLLQERIISKLAGKDNRFMVGDVKQSIYAFRHANPDIFLGLEKRYEEDSGSEAKKLNSNFRSEPRLLEFVNIVFSKIMTELTAKLDYKNTSLFVPRAKYELIEGEGSVQVDLFLKTKSSKSEFAPEVYSVKEAEVGELGLKVGTYEARIVASRIVEAMKKKIYDKDEKKFREVRFSDISILLASRGGYFEDFCKELSRLGFPLYANSRQELYESPSVKVLIAYLKYINNSCDDIPLASTLKLFGFSDGDLFEIRKAQPNEKAFYKAVQNYILQKNDDLSKKLLQFFDEIEKEKFELEFLGIFKALTKVCQKYLLETVTREEYFKVKKFCDEFLANGYNFDLKGFLSFVKDSSSVVKAPNFASGEDCLNITTIHSSKGLEYPIVFVVNLGASFERSKGDNELKLNKDLGVSLKSVASTVYEAVLYKNRGEEFAERLRLLYVALTRAKNKLYLVGSLSGEVKSLMTDYDAQRKKTYLELILGSFNEKTLDELYEKKSARLAEGAEANLLTAEDLLGDKAESEVETGVAKDELLKQFRDYFDYTYPHSTDIALKNSVTKLREEEEFTSKNMMPKSFSLSEHLSFDGGAELGTVYHEIFEKLDFDNLGSFEEFEKFVSNFENANLVDIDKIYAVAKKIRELMAGSQTFKEQQFMLYLPKAELVEGGEEDKILVQGVIDLLSLGSKNIIFDYKLTKVSSPERLKETYGLQLKLYKLAAEKAFSINIDECYIVNINTCELIKVF